MCQIFFCQEGQPSRQILNDANDMNPHGFGFAWTEDGRVVWSKGHEEGELDSKIDEFLALPYPKVIHFRLATHGGRSMEMTHPFNVTKASIPTLQGRSQEVLFHNGVWRGYSSAIQTGILSGTLNKRILEHPMSDSRGMAILAGNFGERFIDILDVSPDKVLIFKGNGEFSSWGDWKSGDVNEEGYPTWYYSNSTLVKPKYKAHNGTETRYPKAVARTSQEQNKSGTSTSGEDSKGFLSNLDIFSLTKDETLLHLQRWQNGWRLTS